MADSEARPLESFEQMSQAQLEIYAKELRQHFLEERRLRVELEEEHRNLQCRMREIAALNRLLQQHLEEYFAVAPAHAQVASKLEQIGKEVQALAHLMRRAAPPSDGSAPPKPME